METDRSDVTDLEFKIFTTRFPSELGKADWRAIIEAILLDNTLSGVHADKFCAVALCRSGMREDQVVAVLQALVSLAHDGFPHLQHAVCAATAAGAIAKAAGRKTDGA